MTSIEIELNTCKVGQGEWSNYCMFQAKRDPLNYSLISTGQRGYQMDIDLNYKVVVLFGNCTKASMRIFIFRLERVLKLLIASHGCNKYYFHAILAAIFDFRR